MDSDGAVARLHRAVGQVVLALEVGDWPAVLIPATSRPVGRGVDGPRAIVRQHAALRCLARSMELQFFGDVHEASVQLESAILLLPDLYAHTAGRTRVALPPPPDGGAAESTTWRIARLVWRELTEIADLRATCAPGRLTPRDYLVEACVHHLMWVDLDPYAPERSRPPAKRPDQSRGCLCRRASALRRLSAPDAADVSQSVWLDAGAFPGLRSRALDRLAERPAPASWCGTTGAEELPIRRGRLRAWEHAQRRKQDRDYWK